MRLREEIERNADKYASPVNQQILQLEVLLDIRELLSINNALLRKIEDNTGRYT